MSRVRESQTKSPAFDRAFDLPNEQRCKSEFGRQVTVDLKADADLNECWRIPSHALLLMLAAINYSIGPQRKRGH